MAEVKILTFISTYAFANRLEESFRNGGVDLEDSDEPPSSQSLEENGANTRKPLVIDLRSMFQFQESHVRESVNLTNCPLVTKRIRDGKMQVKEYLEARVRFDGSQDVVIYEQTGSETTGRDDYQENQSGSGVTEFARLIFENLQKISVDGRIKILEGGFDQFRHEYPSYCTQGVPFIARCFVSTVTDDESTYLNWEATEIRENIYVGALHDAKNDELLDRLKITHILNCCRTESRNEKCNRYRYKELQYEDNLKQSLEDRLESAFEFINEAVNSNGKVLIHCYAGVSRSAAITIAFLMHAFSLSYDEAYKELKSKRTIVAPNINFVSQLMKFDDELKSKRMESGVKKLKLSEDARCLDVKPRRDSLFKKLSAPDLGNDTNLAGSTSPVNKQITKPVGKCVVGLAAKRKLLTPFKIAIAPVRVSGQRFENIASAPIAAANENPFSSAFRNANLKESNPFRDFESCIPE